MQETGTRSKWDEGDRWRAAHVPHDDRLHEERQRHGQRLELRNLHGKRRKLNACSLRAREGGRALRDDGRRAESGEGLALHLHCGRPICGRQLRVCAPLQ